MKTSFLLKSLLSRRGSVKKDWSWSRLPVCCNRIGTQTFRRKVNDCNYWLLFCSLENNSLSDQSWWFWLLHKKIRSFFLLTVFSLLSWAGFVKRGVRGQKSGVYFYGVAHTLRRKRKEMVFCYQNWSDLLWEKIVLVIKKNLRLKAENLKNVWDC